MLDDPQDVTPPSHEASSLGPRARTRGLIRETLGDETLVYDLSTHRAHCLNRSAALVWQLADGERSVAELAEALPRVGLPEEEGLVLAALAELQEADLLEPSPEGSAGPLLTRRDAIRAVGLAAGATLLFPAVDSVTAPLAASAASCLTVQECIRQPSSNCTGLPLCQNRNWCCTLVRNRRGSRCRPRPC